MTFFSPFFSMIIGKFSMIIEKKNHHDHFFLCFEVDAIVYFGAEQVSFDFLLFTQKEKRKDIRV